MGVFDMVLSDEADEIDIKFGINFDKGRDCISDEVARGRGRPDILQ